MFDLYKKTPIGDVITYVRPYQTISHSPLDGPSSMSISEELVTILPDLSTISVPLGTAALETIISDPNQTFDIVNPTTGEVTGSTSFATLKVEMYSLYLYLASIRDQSQALNSLVKN